VSGACTVAAGRAAHCGGGVGTMISIGIDTGIKFVQGIGTVRTGIGRIMNGASPMCTVRAGHGGTRGVAMIHVGIYLGISLVANVGGVRTGIVRGS
jgi:hypothetical protein